MGMPRRNSKGRFVKGSGGGGGRRSGGRRVAARARGAVRRFFGRARGFLPRPSLGGAAKITGGLVAGSAIRRFIDIPYVSEEGLGVGLVACFEGNQTRKDVMGEVAVGLQAKELLDRFGITDAAIDFVTPGRSAGALPPGTVVTDANGTPVGVAQ